MHPTHAEIDLLAFRGNVEAVRAYTGPGIKIMAVVKANAYGHGMVRIAQESVRHGVECLAVARYQEGMELREAGVSCPVLVFEVVGDEHIAMSLEHDLDLTLVSLEGARRLDARARNAGCRARVHVKVDTGMGRLGFAFRDAADSIQAIIRLTSLDLIGVYSHFATSEDPDRSFAREQLDYFCRVLDELDRRRIEFPLRHMANSGAVIGMPETHFDMVRPGIMLYGYTPRNGMSEDHPVRPVMSLKSCVTFLKTVNAGTSISYGRRYIAPTRTAVATVPIGYADGYNRLLSNKASVLIHGRRYPVVGTICMDHIMIDVGLDDQVQEGDNVTLMGEGLDGWIDAWELADLANSIPYEVTSRVSERIPRVYRS